MCDIDHPHPGRSGCDQPEHDGLMVRLDLADTAESHCPAPTNCRRCYLAMSPSTRVTRGSARRSRPR
ncbi:hypothetical protein AB0G00_36955 [Nocardia salmonicida]